MPCCIFALDPPISGVVLEHCRKSLILQAGRRMAYSSVNIFHFDHIRTVVGEDLSAKRSLRFCCSVGRFAGNVEGITLTASTLERSKILTPFNAPSDATFSSRLSEPECDDREVVRVTNVVRAGMPLDHLTTARGDKTEKRALCILFFPQYIV